MYEEINEEVKKIISEGWTDGMAVQWGTPNDTHSIYVGTISGSNSVPVSENTIYDLASVTKIFFLICILKLVEKNVISLDAYVGDYSNLFPYISDLKIYELMNFSKPLQTSRRIDSCENYNDAISILQDVRVVDGNPRYSDMGAIILSLIIDNIPGASFRKLLCEMKESCPLDNTYFWDDLPTELLSQTQSYDKEYVLTDTKIITRHTPVGTPHDKKARILGTCGHAGVFSTPKDIAVLSRDLLSQKIISRETLSLVSSSKYDFFIDEQHFGLLCYKKSANQKKSEIPSFFSDSAFAISGFTGTYLLLDPETHLFISINSNRIFNRCPHVSNKNASIKGTKNYVYRKDSILNLIVPYILFLG